MSADLPGFDVHPVADLFPLIEGDKFAELVADIRANGLIEEVTVDRDGLLIDGRNRVRACAAAGVEVRTREYDGGDPTSFIVSLNMQRRHLTDAQRAMIAAEIASLPVGVNQFRREGPSSDGPSAAPTQEQVRRQMQVSDGSMSRARSIVTHGTHELAELAKAGKVPLSTGARVAQLHAEEQDKFVDQVKEGAKPIDVAPPRAPKPQEPAPIRPPAPPKYGSNRRKHLAQLDAVTVGLSGYQIIADEIAANGLDDSVDGNDAARLASGITNAIRSLNRVNNLLKERSK